MNKPDITKGKDSGPKDIKGKGNRPKNIKDIGSGHKETISDKAHAANDFLKMAHSPERKPLKEVIADEFNNPLPINLLQEKIIPKSKNREDYLVTMNISEVDNQFDQVRKKLQDFILESKFENIGIPLSADICLSDFFNNKLLIIQTIEKGIPFSIFESIKNATPLTTNDWADYLGLSSRSLNRYFIQNKTFAPIYSEKIIELIEVFKLGLEVFGDQNSFNQWLNTPNFALGNTKPFELLKNSYGKEMVISELTGISHGILV